jgi:hypothetical protein
MKIDFLIPKFVEFIPEPPLMEDGILYISRAFQIAIHRCACGCGVQTVTPLGPGDWTMTEKDGFVTLRPSIGNQQFPCKSHYLITDNKIQWC